MLTTCSDAFYDYLVDCDETLRVNAVFIPTTQYTWVITDKFGNEYSGSVTTDADGQMDIEVADLPEGLLNPYSGTFTLRIQDTECQWLPLKMMKVYDSVVFEVKGGTRSKNSLGCEVDCTISGNPSNSAVYNFLISDPEDDVRTINWTLEQRTLYGNTPTVQVLIQTEVQFTYRVVDVEILYNENETILESLDIDFGGIGYFMVIIRG